MTKKRRIQAQVVTINTPSGPQTYKKLQGALPDTAEFLMVTDEDGTQHYFVKNS